MPRIMENYLPKFMEKYLPVTPKSFNEKVNMIIIFFGKKTNHLGEELSFSHQELFSALFIDRYDVKYDKTINKYSCKRRKYEDLADEMEFILNYLQEANYLKWLCPAEMSYIRLTPTAYMRLDEIQRNPSKGKNVLVAMKFGKETVALREAIRQGIADAGYFAVFIDEVQHNDFITPELLKKIRDSRFVVVDLSHKNNGAYFEEGYAMGVGKPVIQLCRADVELHFDIAQKNTIMWKSEEEIPQRLADRIRASIE